MSQTEIPALTTTGDAVIVKAVKIDPVDDVLQVVIEPERINRASEAETTAATEEVPIFTQNTEVNGSQNTFVKKDTNSVAAELIDTVVKIVDTTTSVARQETALCSDEKKSKGSKQNAKHVKSNNAASVSNLEEEVRKKTKECDRYREKLENTEKKFATLQAAYNAMKNHGGDENNLQQSVDQLQGQLAQTALMYEERNQVIAKQENQINALNNQVSSLKEIVSITRDLLQIRNMEVKQLQTEVDNMEKKIVEERERHNAMISKMDTAIQLNADLKKEYKTQLSLFQSLREKYGEKITLLSEEKRVLEAARTPK